MKSLCLLSTSCGSYISIEQNLLPKSQFLFHSKRSGESHAHALAANKAGTSAPTSFFISRGSHVGGPGGRASGPRGDYRSGTCQLSCGAETHARITHSPARGQGKGGTTTQPTPEPSEDGHGRCTHPNERDFFLVSSLEARGT